MNAPSDMRLERFLRWVVKTEGCWLWKGGKNGSGYGTFSFASHQSMPAHRASYILLKGEIPKGMLVLHYCDNKLCVCPDHLRLGTHADNMADASVRGLIVSGPDHYFSKVRFRGEERPQSKLTDDIVRQARELHAGGKLITDLARQFGVHENTMRSAVKRRTWTHI